MFPIVGGLEGCIRIPSMSLAYHQVGLHHRGEGWGRRRTHHILTVEVCTWHERVNDGHKVRHFDFFSFHHALCVIHVSDRAKDGVGGAPVIIVRIRAWFLLGWQE